MHLTRVSYLDMRITHDLVSFRHQVFEETKHFFLNQNKFNYFLRYLLTSVHFPGTDCKTKNIIVHSRSYTQQPPVREDPSLTLF